MYYRLKKSPPFILKYITDAEQLKGVKVLMKELDDVLFRDVGGKIAADGRYPDNHFKF